MKKITNTLVRVLSTEGTGSFVETIHRVEYAHDSVLVKTLYAGVGRRDIEMMKGLMRVPPSCMSGREGLGVVIALPQRRSAYGLAIGDIVATSCGPAFADSYTVPIGSYVKVPRLSPEYILDPIASGINIITQYIDEIKSRGTTNSKMLIIGCGMAAYIAYSTARYHKLSHEITVVGSHNKDLWGSLLVPEPKDTHYDVIIDLSNKNMVFDDPTLYNKNSLILFCTQKPKLTTDFSDMMAKQVTVKFPNPNNADYHSAMVLAEAFVTSKYIDAARFWTHGHNRNGFWKQAFYDGSRRVASHSRGYLIWE